MSDLPRINPPSLSVTKLDVPKLNVPRLSVPVLGGTKTYYPRAINTEERRHVRDLGDILLGNPITGTKQLRNTLIDNNAAELQYRPILGRLAGTLFMFKERTIDPISKGNYGEAIINNIESLGYTLDIVANPVKSLMPWAGGGSTTDLFKSMGWVENAYRETYQWDTGNFVVDVIGEYLSDPLNWFNVADIFLEPKAIKALDDAVTDTIIKDTGTTLVGFSGNPTLDQLYIRNLGKTVAATAADQDSTIVKDIMKRIKSNRAQYLDNLTKLRRHNPDLYEKAKVFLTDFDTVIKNDLKGTITKAVYNLRNERGFQIYNSIKKSRDLNNSLNKGLFELAFASAPLINAGRIGVNNIVKPTFKVLQSTYLNKLNNIDVSKLFPNNAQVTYKELVDELLLKDAAIHKQTYNVFEEIFNKYNLDTTKVQRMFIRIYNDLKGSEKTIENAVDIFTRRLIRYVPELRGVLKYTTEIGKKELKGNLIDLANTISKESFDNLIEVVSELAEHIDELGEQYTLRIIKNVENDFKKWLKEVNVTDDVSNRLNYVFDNYLEYNGTRYTLDNLKEYLDTLTVNDPERYVEVSTVLDYFGITISNAPILDTLLKENSAYLIKKNYNEYMRYLRSEIKRLRDSGKAYKHLLKEYNKYKGDLGLANFITTRFGANAYDIGTIKAAKNKTKSIEKLILNSKTGSNFQGLTDKDLNNLLKNTRFPEALSNPKEYERLLNNMGDYSAEMEMARGRTMKVIDFQKDLQLQIDTSYNIANNKFLKKYKIPLSEYFDELISYAGLTDDATDIANLPMSTLLNNILKFDFNKDYDYIIVNDYFEALRKKIKSLRVKDVYEEIKSREVRNFIDEVNDLLDETITPKTRVYSKAFKELVEENNQLYTIALNKRKNLETIYNALQSKIGDNGSWDPEVKEWFFKLIEFNPLGEKNVVRDTLINIATEARKQGFPQIAETIEQTVAELMQLMNYVGIYDSILTKYKGMLSNSQYHYIVNLVSDVILNTKGTGNVTHYVDKTNELVDAFFRQYYGFGQSKIIREDFVKNKFGDINKPKLTNELVTTLDDYAMADDFVTKLPEEVYEEAVEDYKVINDAIDTFEEQLKKDVTVVINNYLDNLNYIARSTHRIVAISPQETFNRTLSRLETIAQDYLRYMEHMSDPEQIEALRMFVSNTVGSKIAPTLSTPIINKHEFNKVQDYIKNNLDLRKLTEDIKSDDLYATIREAYIQINNINADLITLSGIRHTYNVLSPYPVKEAMRHNNPELSGVVKRKQDMQKATHIIAYIDKMNADAYVKSTGIANNLHDWVLANDLGLTFKKAKIPYVLKDSSLFVAPYDATGKFMEFSDNYMRAYYRVAQADDTAFIKTDLLDEIRESLIETYTEWPVEWAPKNPVEYFNNLKYDELYAWHIVTNTKPMDVGLSVYYKNLLEKRVKLKTDPNKPKRALDKVEFTIGERIDYNESGSSMYESLEGQLQKGGFTDEHGYDELIRTVGYKQYAGVKEYVVDDLKSWVKDPDTLIQNRFHITQHINQNVDSYENLRDITKLTDNIDTIASKNFNEQELAMLKGYNIWEDTPLNSPNVLRFLTEERVSIDKESFKSWTPKEVRSYLDNESALGFIIFIDDVNSPKLYQDYTESALKRAGIKIAQPFKDNPNIYLIRRTNDVIHKNTHKYIKPNYLFKEEQDVVTDIFIKNKNYFTYDGAIINPEMFTGNLIDNDAIDVLLDLPEFSEILGDAVERKAYLKSYSKGINKFTPLSSVIKGNVQDVNRFYELVVDAFDNSSVGMPFRSGELPRLVYAGNHEAITMSNNIIKYLELFLNEDYYLGSKHFVEAFKGVSDAEINNFFKRGNFIAMVAKEDKEGLPKVFKYIINNRVDLNNAIKQGAVCVPYEVYRNAVLVVNKRLCDSKLLNLYKKTIVGTFKSIYLTSAGFLMRNEADSALYKNMATMGNKNIFEAFQYQMKASKMWRRYNEIQNAIIESTGGITLNKRAVRSYLQKLPFEDRELYYLVDTFAMSSASGGLSDSLEKLLREYASELNESYEFAWARAFNEKVLMSDYMPTKFVGDINSWIEQTSRLGLFLKVVEETGDYADAISKVVATHFDYQLKEPGLSLIEDIFWFSTFPINNIAYYMNEGLTTNPAVFKTYMDMVEQSWNNGDITWDDVKHNNYYTYNVMAGNLRFNVLGRDIILKTGSSVMDFLSILSDPYSAVKDRLNPFLSILLGIEGLGELNPLQSQLNRINNFGLEPGKSLVPSVYSTLYPRKQYFKTYYKPSTYYRYNWTRYPRRVYAHSYNKYNYYRFMTNRYYFNKGTNKYKLWVISTNSIEPNWYMNNYRRYANRRYNRMQRKVRGPSR